MGAEGGSQHGLRQVSRMEKGGGPSGTAVCSEAGVGVRTPPQGAGAHSGLGSQPGCGAGAGPWAQALGQRRIGRLALWAAPRRGGGPRRTSEVGGSRPHRGMFWRSRKQSPWARSGGTVWVPGAVVPGTVPGTRWFAVGPCGERRPLARGRRTEAGGEGEPRVGTVVSGAAIRVGTRGSCAPCRGGGETGERPWLLPPGVPRVTAAAAILPHTDPPPAPAHSGVRRHCARGGASQLRGWGQEGNLGSAHVGFWVGRWAEGLGF
nr:LOW QUALITY PROTEIN: elastin-like [Aotus nancymaae]